MTNIWQTYEGGVFTSCILAHIYTYMLDMYASTEWEQFEPYLMNDICQ